MRNQTFKIVVGASSFATADQYSLNLLKQHGYQVRLNPYGRKLTEAETIDFLKGADGLLAGLEPLNRLVLESARGQLKAIARIGVGMTNVDQEAAAELGFKVSNTPDGPTQGVAEMTLAALLTLGRRLITTNAALHERKWPKELGRSLDGLKVLVAGYGRIGRRVAELLKAFQAEVLIYDPACPELSVPSLAEGLKQAQVVSLHAGGEEELIGPRELALLPEGALLLNSARGGLVDEEALYQALQSGRLAGCWLDVFREEPYSGPLCDCPTALLTPHTGTYTDKCRQDMERQATLNLLRDLDVL